jgi:hypothetical protein
VKDAEKNNDQKLAVLSAMLKAGLKPKPKLDAIEYARRLAVEKALQQRRYCDALALWRPARAKHAAGRAAAAEKQPAACAARSIAYRTRRNGARGRTSSPPRRATSARRSARHGNACRGICMSRRRRHNTRGCERRRHLGLPLPRGERVGVRGFGRFRTKLDRPNPLILSFSPISAFTRVFDALWGRRMKRAGRDTTSANEATITSAPTARCRRPSLSSNSLRAAVCRAI